MDPISILSILCSLGCCLFFAVGFLAVVIFLLKGKKKDPANATADASEPEAIAEEPPDASAPNDFEEEDMATVVAPPPVPEVPDIPEPPAPPAPSAPEAPVETSQTEEEPRPSMPSLSDAPLPPKRLPPRSSGQTIIAFDDDDDDDF